MKFSVVAMEVSNTRLALTQMLMVSDSMVMNTDIV